MKTLDMRTTDLQPVYMYTIYRSWFQFLLRSYQHQSDRITASQSVNHKYSLTIPITKSTTKSIHAPNHQHCNTTTTTNSTMASNYSKLGHSLAPQLSDLLTTLEDALIESNARLDAASQLPFYAYRRQDIFLHPHGYLRTNTAFRRYGPAFYTNLVAELEDLADGFMEAIQQVEDNERQAITTQMQAQSFADGVTMEEFLAAADANDMAMESPEPVPTVPKRGAQYYPDSGIILGATALEVYEKIQYLSQVHGLEPDFQAYTAWVDSLPRADYMAIMMKMAKG